MVVVFQSREQGLTVAFSDGILTVLVAVFEALSECKVADIYTSASVGYCSGHNNVRPTHSSSRRPVVLSYIQLTAVCCQLHFPSCLPIRHGTARYLQTPPASRRRDADPEVPGPPSERRRDAAVCFISQLPSIARRAMQSPRVRSALFLQPTTDS